MKRIRKPKLDEPTRRTRLRLAVEALEDAQDAFERYTSNSSANAMRRATHDFVAAFHKAGEILKQVVPLEGWADPHGICNYLFELRNFRVHENTTVLVVEPKAVQIGPMLRVRQGERVACSGGSIQWESTEGEMEQDIEGWVDFTGEEIEIGLSKEYPVRMSQMHVRIGPIDRRNIGIIVQPLREVPDEERTEAIFSTAIDILAREIQTAWPAPKVDGRMQLQVKEVLLELEQHFQSVKNSHASRKGS